MIFLDLFLIFAQTDGIVLVLIDHTCTRGSIVGRMRHFFHKNWVVKYVVPSICCKIWTLFSVPFGTGSNIHKHREIQCFLHKGFFFNFFKQIVPLHVVNVIKLHLLKCVYIHDNIPLYNFTMLRPYNLKIYHLHHYIAGDAGGWTLRCPQYLTSQYSARMQCAANYPRPIVGLLEYSLLSMSDLGLTRHARPMKRPDGGKGCTCKVCIFF